KQLGYIRRLHIDETGMTTQIPSKDILENTKKRKRDFESITSETKRIKVITKNGNSMDVIQKLRSLVLKAKKSLNDACNTLSGLSEQQEIQLKNNQQQVNWILKELNELSNLKNDASNLMNKY